MTKCPRAVIFDLDGTLAFPWESPTSEVAMRLSTLLATIPVAVMSSASLERVQQSILPVLPKETDLKRFYLLPSAAGACYVQENGVWKCHYNLLFSQAEKEKVLKALQDGIRETRIVENEQIYGSQFLDNESQIICALIGLDAPPKKKAEWDPDRKKRQPIKRFLEKRLPQFGIAFGGRASIEITHKGVDKAYGVRWLAEHLKAQPKDLIFVGDAFYPGGNDYSVIKTGVQTIEVSGPHETEKVIDEILSVCAQPNK
ncbi:MAG: HAD family hydrolase [Parcubacteria group bacterium GW2011_GWA2_51_10]|nr:MAG: HAD family hydrolase [Parcubacteria group bacterium GW2011_GWA2_51_10]